MNLNLNGWSETPQHPWRRSFARAIDVTVCWSGIYFALGSLLIIVAPQAAMHIANNLTTANRTESLVNSMVLSFLSLFITAAMIGKTGSSLGKWIFGIKVYDHDYRKLGFKRAFRRELLVWMNGLAVGLPVVSVVAELLAYNRLLEKNITSWDEEMNLRVIARPNDSTQNIRSFLGVVAIIFAFIKLQGI